MFAERLPTYPPTKYVTCFKFGAPREFGAIHFRILLCRPVAIRYLQNAATVSNFAFKRFEKRKAVVSHSSLNHQYFGRFRKTHSLSKLYADPGHDADRNAGMSPVTRGHISLGLV